MKGKIPKQSLSLISFYFNLFQLAMVEFQINHKANPHLIIILSITTSLLIAATLISIVISTWSSPYIRIATVLKDYSYNSFDDSEHVHFIQYINLAWVFTNSVSIFLFVLNIILIAWLQSMHFGEAAAWCATVIILPVLIAICTFMVIFYKNMV